MTDRSIQHGMAFIMIALVNSYTVTQAKDPSAFDLFDKVQGELPEDDVRARDVMTSDLADKFVKAYLTRKTVESDRIWAVMLKKLGDVKSCSALSSDLYGRIQMDAPDDATLNSVYSRHSFFSYMVTATEKAVGKDHRFMVDAYSQSARTYEGARNWKDAIPLRIKRTQLCEKLFGYEAEPTLNSRLDVIRDQMKMQQYANVEPRLKTIIEQCKKHKYGGTGERAAKQYLLFLTLNNRKADYDKFTAEYQSYFPHHH